MNPLSHGDGAFTPIRQWARQFFANKPRALTDKLTTVEDAVARLVHDGDYLAIRLVVLALPWCRPRDPASGQQNLRFAGHTATHDFQICVPAI